MAKTKNINNNPIGIFDSGIGGLTVASAIHKVLPNESIVYFGDTAHMPYGDKSSDAIKYYSIRIADFLLKQQCKIIVIACNTASSIAFEAVKKHIADKVPVISVIDPVAIKVAALYKNTRVGVIATKGTIKTDMYAKKITALNHTIQVQSVATPLLAPMIEEGFFNNKISKTIINSYLSKNKLKKIESLILACTHYPLIKPEIEEYYKGKVKIIDSADIVAEAVLNKLAEFNLLQTSNKPDMQFYVSDYTKSFEETSKLFFKHKIKLSHYPLWENE